VEALTQFLFLFLQVTELEFLDKLHQLTARLEEQDLALAILKVSRSTYSRSACPPTQGQPAHLLKVRLPTYSRSACPPAQGQPERPSQGQWVNQL
jgi:hypothetical protein